MKRTPQYFSLSVLSAALFAAYGAVHASEIDELSKPESTISVGIGGWSGERKQSAIYDSMDGGDTYALIDADIKSRDDASGTWMNFSTRNLGLDSREVKAEWLRQGNFGITLDYSRTPRTNPYDYSTRLSGIGATSQTVNGVGAAKHYELGTVRDGVGLKIYKALADNVDFNISFKNEEKTGTRHWGRGGQPDFAVEPINSVTREVEAVLAYSGKEFQISGGYLGSWYINRNDLVVVSGGANCSNNPAGFTNTACFLTLPLDNEAHQVFVDAGYDFTPTTRGMLKASYGTASQKEDVATDNIVAGARLSQLGTPSNVDGRINTALVQMSLSSRPLPKLSLLGNLRYQDIADKTPVKKYVSNTVYNTPHSFTTTSGKLDATYGFSDGYSLNAGVDYSDQDRSYPVVGLTAVPFRTNLTETTWRAQIRKTLGESLNGAVGVSTAERVGHFYSTRTSTATIGAPGTLYNPLHISDRQREKARMALDWAPTEKWSVQFIAESAKDTYGQDSKPYGLKAGGAELYSLDSSLSISDDWSLNGWINYDKTRANQKVANSTGRLGNDVRLEEASTAVGVGLKGKVTSRIGVGTDIEWTQSTSKFHQSGALANLNAIHSDTFRLKLNSTYALRKNAELRFDVIHEYWSTDDWTWTFFNSEAFRYSDGTTVTADQKQTSNFFGARYVYHFQ